MRNIRRNNVDIAAFARDHFVVEGMHAASVDDETDLKTVVSVQLLGFPILPHLLTHVGEDVKDAVTLKRGRDPLDLILYFHHTVPISKNVSELHNYYTTVMRKE